VFRYAEDRLAVLLITILTAIDFVVYVSVDSVWLLLGYMLLMILPKGMVSAWNHHHQHVHTFRSTPLNRLLEVSYGLHTGMPTNMWVLHHVLGHHVNYLDQTKDESRWMRKDGTTMGEAEYGLVVGLTSIPRAIGVGRRHPKALRQFLIFGGMTFALAGLLTYLRPLAGLFVFVLPMVIIVFYTSWVTYDHHVGLHTDDPFEGSFNIMNRWFNITTGNLGYHTAHHYKQGVHWSKLPELHERIKHRIPAQLYTKSIFDKVLPDAEPAGPLPAADADPAE